MTAGTASPLVATTSWDPDDSYTTFTDWWNERGIELYSTQDEAVLELASGSHVILSTPTGSGKSLVAGAALYFALCRGERAYYTAPIKALVSEKFFDLCRQFGADQVGMMTGDASVNPQAPIICATAEIVANIALREGDSAAPGVIVMDEFHYYAEPDRGWAWQVPLIELPQFQFLLMSATLGDVSFFVDDLRTRTGRVTAAITGTTRPVPLEYAYSLTPTVHTITELLENDRGPVYVVHFTQAAAVTQAQSLLSVTVADRATRDAIATEIGDFRFATGFGKVLSRLVRAGIGIHHAGMLPRYRRLVERLAQQGLLRVICGTDTLGVGINVPIRTVLFTGLTKFDGVRQRHLRAREFHQIAGRAGRAGYDTVGYVVAQAPEHDVENARAVAKAGDDPKKLKKIQRKKAPEGFVSWSEATFDKLVAAPPEPLRSRFAVSTSMLLEVIARPGDCFAHMRHLLEANHEPRDRQRTHIRRAIALYRGLLSGNVVQRLDQPDRSGKWIAVAADLPKNFALTNPLSEFALAATDILDYASDDYPLQLISLIESTLEDPRQVLMAQQRVARDAAVAAMKADGIEYDERMDRLSEISWPKPEAALIEAAFEIYQQSHPWLRGTHPAPKSVLRYMIEHALTFNEFVSEFGLARSEGVLLRYLTDAYRVLRQGISLAARSAEVDEIIEWLGVLISQIDSSLVDEWEQLSAGSPDRPTAEATAPAALTTQPRALRIMVRNAMFRVIELVARRRWEQLPGDVDWPTELAAYFDEYGDLGTGPSARGPALFSFDGDRLARQVFDDPDGDHGWAVEVEIDREATDQSGEVVFASLRVITG